MCNMGNIKPEMIAPCGMNCALCLSNQRKGTKREKHCDGCSSLSVAAATRCTIRRCSKREDSKSGFCYECAKFPCKRILQLDARYRGKYGMSLIKNLESIQQDGVEAFIEKENKLRTCKVCGNLICIHRDYCLHCKTKWKTDD